MEFVATLPFESSDGKLDFINAVQLPHMLFTSLDDYRARGTEAAPYFTVTHYTDLAPSKQLVLVRGDIVFTSRLKDEEVFLLAYIVTCLGRLSQYFFHSIGIGLIGHVSV